MHFRCATVHIKSSLRKFGVSYKIQLSLLKQELENDENYEHNWEKKENEWLLYLINDVLSTVFSYARYTMGMEEIIEFGVKNSVKLPSLAIGYFSSLKDENDEPINTYTDPFIRNFVCGSKKGARCEA